MERPYFGREYLESTRKLQYFPRIYQILLVFLPKVVATRTSSVRVSLRYPFTPNLYLDLCLDSCLIGP